MAVYRAGQEIDAYCTRCKLDLLHRIVAVVDGKPVKVECRTCLSVHMYRAPKSLRATVSTTPSATTDDASKSARKTSPVENVALVPPPAARVYVYKVTEKYAPECWIQHKTFGTGQVLREIPPNKIEVRFEDGNRVLVHGLTQ